MSKLTDALSIISGLATLVDGATKIGIPVSLEVKVGRLTEAVEALAEHVANILKDDSTDDERVQAMTLRVADLEEKLNAQGIALEQVVIKVNSKAVVKTSTKPKTPATKKAA